MLRDLAKIPVSMIQETKKPDLERISTIPETIPILISEGFRDMLSIDSAENNQVQLWHNEGVLLKA